MLLKLILLFIGIPFLEIALLVKLASLIGFWDTLLIQVVTGVAGATLAQRQGLTVWMQIQQELELGHMPADKLIDGVLIFGAGIVLLTPGLMTDLLGFIILIPGTRVFFSRWIAKKFQHMSQTHQGDFIVMLK